MKRKKHLPLYRCEVSIKPVLNYLNFVQVEHLLTEL